MSESKKRYSLKRTLLNVGKRLKLLKWSQAKGRKQLESKENINKRRTQGKQFTTKTQITFLIHLKQRKKPPHDHHQMKANQQRGKIN